MFYFSHDANKWETFPIENSFYGWGVTRMSFAFSPRLVCGSVRTFEAIPHRVRRRPSTTRPIPTTARSIRLRTRYGKTRREMTPFQSYIRKRLPFRRPIYCCLICCFHSKNFSNRFPTLWQIKVSGFYYGRIYFHFERTRAMWVTYFAVSANDSLPRVQKSYYAMGIRAERSTNSTKFGSSEKFRTS